MRGFFTKEETKNLSRNQAGFNTCYNCGLFAKVKTPKFEPYGLFKKGILIIGEAPTNRDDRTGKLWKEEDGILLRNTLAKYGFDLYEDCMSINAINCFPGEKSKANQKQINCCRDVKVLRTIHENDPNVIILLGTSAVNSVIGHRWKDTLGTIAKWRGFNIPDRDFKSWVCPTYHPSYVLAVENKAVKITWEKDIEKALGLCDVRVPKSKKERIHVIEDLSPLNEIQNGLVTFDYETTGLKPQAKGHRIVCASVAYNENNAYSFMMPKKKEDREPLVNLLSNRHIDKAAANMKYEDTWTNIRLKRGAVVNGWVHDTMLCAHYLDNRPGITGLKFQTYVRLGVVEYNEEVAPYLKAKTKGGNEINRIQELLDRPGGADLLLKYCGLDSIYEYRLTLLQMEDIGYDILPF